MSSLNNTQKIFIKILEDTVLNMNSNTTLKIGVINGALRTLSNNTALATIIQHHKPLHVQILHFKIDDLPLMNEDLELHLDAGKTISLPTPVHRIRKQAEQCTAFLFTSPEYNGGITGSLKNAYDWLSRDYTRFGSSDSSPIAGKKLGVVGASYLSEDSIKDVRRMVEYLKLDVFQETFYTKLGKNFDGNGKLINSQQEQRLSSWALSFYSWIRAGSSK